MHFWEKRAIYKKVTKNVLTLLRRLTYETSPVRFVRRCNTLYYIAGSKGSENKENINDCRGFIVLQTHLAFFLGSGSKNIILASFKIKRNRLLNDKSFIDKACSVKMTGHSLRSFSPFFH